MKVYVACGASRDGHYAVPLVYGAFTNRADALTTLMVEWLRIEHMIDSCELNSDPNDPANLNERVQNALQEWQTKEFPIIACDGDETMDLREIELDY